MESFVRFARRTGAIVCAEGIESLDDAGGARRPRRPVGTGLRARAARRAVGAGLAGRRRGVPGLARPGAARQPGRQRPDRRRRPAARAPERQARERPLRQGPRRRPGPDRRGAPGRHGLPLPLAARRRRSSRRWPRAAGRARSASRSPSTRSPAGSCASSRPPRSWSATPRPTRRRSSCCSSLGLRSLLIVPVVSHGETLGIVEAYSEVERPWTRTQINRARIISNQFGSVIQAVFRPDAGRAGLGRRLAEEHLLQQEDVERDDQRRQHPAERRQPRAGWRASPSRPRRRDQHQRDEGERNAEREHHLADHERVRRVHARRRARSAPAPGSSRAARRSGCGAG